MILLLAALIVAFSAAQDATPPRIELNASLPLNVTSNLTVLLSANFSDSEGGFVGNKNLSKLSDNSTIKNFTFSSGANQTAYLAVPNRSKVISAAMNVRGERENSTSAVFPANVLFDVGNNSVKEFSHSGALNSTETISNFSGEISEYLAVCKSFVSEGCLVPIVLSFDSGGVVEISNISVTYLLNQSCGVCVARDRTCDSEWTTGNVTTLYSGDYLSGNCSSYWNTSAYGDDNYNISFRISNMASNVGISSRIITLDRTAPTFKYAKPNVGIIDGNAVLVVNNTNSANSSTEVAFKFSIDDLSEFGSCSLVFNGKVNKTNSSLQYHQDNQEFTLIISTNVSELRYYNWSIRCSDVFGNERTTETKKLAVLVLGIFSGETTDLSAVNLSRIGNLTFEDARWGKIKFSKDVNLSGISGVLNIADYVKIFNNSIEINSTAIPALNTTATLILHNLTYAIPRIVKDGVVCPPEICKIVNYSNGTLTFNVTQFSVYSAEEAPPSVGDAPSGGNGGGSSGGGGGGGGSFGGTLVSETSVLQAELRAGDSGTFAFKKFGELAVYEIVAESAAVAVNPSVTVREVRPSSSVPSPLTDETGKVYKNLSITKSSFENISGAAIKFKVNNTWLDENSINPATVKLSRSEKSSWSTLPTALLGRDAGFTSYQAVVSGFSIFAIAGNFKTPPPLSGEASDEVKADKTAARSSEQSKVPLSEDENAKEALQGRIPPEESFSAVTGRAVSSEGSGKARFEPAIFALIILGALAIFLWRKKLMLKKKQY